MTEIADLALIGDCATAALVSADGSVQWWPGPRFDGPSVLSAILDPSAGHFSLRPVAPARVRRAYVSGTMVLRTEHHTGSGTLVVTDCLALEPGARGHEIGLRSPQALVRVMEAVDGDVEVSIEVAPRLEYGLAVPRLIARDGRLQTDGGAERLFLTGVDELAIDGANASGTLVVRRGERRGGRSCAARSSCRRSPISPAAPHWGTLRRRSRTSR